MKNEIFITKALEKHGNKYNYSLVDYKNNKTKIDIICDSHGKFSQTPNAHLNGQRCPGCSALERKDSLSLGNDLFVKKSIEIHGDLYDYRNSNYSNVGTPVKILCHKHGEFNQIPRNHLNGNGCPKCAIEAKKVILSAGILHFIRKSENVHNDTYDYSKSTYINNKTTLIVICKIHGEFLITPSHHYQGSGCKKCSGTHRRSTNDFISDSIFVHGNKYDYTETQFKSTDSNVNILCRKHGIFVQNASHHLKGHGCPSCSESKGEIFISEILKNNNIYFLKQKKFDTCRSTKGHKLKFDFYLPSINICIEFDGQQHFEKCDFFGGEEKFETQVENDTIKNKFCSDNGIELIRIKYNDTNINELLINKILKMT
jgi:very-short-patch-repair endonuclease